jgi:hypothetical protein
MTEQPQPQEKQYKQSPEDREYFRTRRRKQLAKQKHCKVCNGPAVVRVLLTQDLYCLKDYVAFLKNGGSQNAEKVTNGDT